MVTAFELAIFMAVALRLASISLSF